MVAKPSEKSPLEYENKEAKGDKLEKRICMAREWEWERERDHLDHPTYLKAMVIVFRLLGPRRRKSELVDQGCGR